jgi:predicted NBD/HSP70 family sugar kinase
LREVAAVHGWAISQMVQLVDPEIVVLAGPLTGIGEPYLEAVTNVALQFESDYHPTVPIRSSNLGEYAGAVGAAALALQRWRPDDVG